MPSTVYVIIILYYCNCNNNELLLVSNTRHCQYNQYFCYIIIICRQASYHICTFISCIIIIVIVVYADAVKGNSTRHEKSNTCYYNFITRCSVLESVQDTMSLAV